MSDDWKDHRNKEELRRLLDEEGAAQEKTAQTSFALFVFVVVAVWILVLLKLARP